VTRRFTQQRYWLKLTDHLMEKYTPDAPSNDVDRTLSAVTQDIKDRVFAHACLDWEHSMRPKEKLRLYLEANEDMEFKPYLEGYLDMGTNSCSDSGRVTLPLMA
jgi:hypothetical protein